MLVTGGGGTARFYIHALEKLKAHEDFRSWVGIESTRLNATLLSSIFKRLECLPESLKAVKALAKKRRLIICGSLGFQPKMTSDGNAAQIACALKADAFINLTNVDGLYSKDPREFKDAEFVSKVSYQGFLRFFEGSSFKPGQHFVLDRPATLRVAKAKIPTVILHGKKLANFKKYLSGDSFKGTVIS